MAKPANQEKVREKSQDKAQSKAQEKAQSKAQEKSQSKAEEKAQESAQERAAAARLKEVYKKEIVPALTKQFGYKSTMEVPRITKIVLNMGVGEAVGDKKILENAAADMTKISGQKPIVTKARKAIAAFKIREGYPIGCMVTLRENRMYEFLDRLVSIALPRVRDFKGVSPKGFDGRGNYTLGLRDQLLFPEIDYMKVDKARGMNVSVVTSARTDEEARKLLQLMGMPFRTN